MPHKYFDDAGTERIAMSTVIDGQMLDGQIYITDIYIGDKPRPVTVEVLGLIRLQLRARS